MKLISFFWHFSCLKLFGYRNTVLMDIVEYIIIYRSDFSHHKLKMYKKYYTSRMRSCQCVSADCHNTCVPLFFHIKTQQGIFAYHSAQLTSAHSLSSGPLSISSFDSSAHISSLFFVGQVFIYTQLPLIYPHTRRHPR